MTDKVEAVTGKELLEAVLDRLGVDDLLCFGVYSHPVSQPMTAVRVVMAVMEELKERGFVELAHKEGLG